MEDRKMPRLVIAGAGPAGLFCACRLALCAGKQADILVLEKMPRPGLKLLASGSGQCNISHAGPIRDFLGHYGGKERFLKPALLGFDNQSLLDFFRERGVDFETEEESGKVFPVSRRASSVLDALLSQCKELGVELRLGQSLKSIRVKDPQEGGGFGLSCAEDKAGEIDTQALLIACGGRSYPRCGSAGEGYELARALGHRIVDLRPALSPVRVRDFSLAELSGLSFSQAGMELYRAGKKLLERRGDLLITHKGFSGPLILDSSRSIRPGDELRLNFSTLEVDIKAELDRAITQAPKSLARGLLARIGLPKSLGSVLSRLAGIGENLICAELTRESRRTLCSLATAFPAQVEALGSWDEAMVSAGGVDLAEVDSQTMASRLIPGLFFAGEILDIDGDTGGYNLQAAFSTGDCAARGIASFLFPKKEC